MVWIFGDSFSAPYNNPEVRSWAQDYIKWKGYIPNTFGDNIANKLNTQVRNLSIGGFDNDSMFELLLKHAPEFKKDDVIIIGWSDITRFRLVNDVGRFVSVIVNMDNSKLISTISEDTINEILVNRSHNTYFEEFRIRTEFLNWVFKDYVFIQWTPFQLVSDTIFYNVNFFNGNKHNIKLDTNGLIKDLHYSEIGHQELTEDFLKLINDENLRHEHNTITVRNKNLI
jgi:hypothetical protein